MYLEKSVVDLADFKELANRSRSLHVSEQHSGPSKRPMITSGSSPEAFRLRPCSKIPRRTFTFNSEYWI